MAEEKKLYLDKEGYEQYLEEIRAIREKLTNNGKNKSEAYTSAVGDGWHDNFAFEEAKREEFKILAELRAKLEGLSQIEIIDSVMDSDLIDINDYVSVAMQFSDDDLEEFFFKLVALSSPNFDSEIREVSVNSPLGKTVYQKRDGDTGSYEVDGNRINISIISHSKDKDTTLGLKRG